MTLDPRLTHLVLLAIASALMVIAGVKLARYVFRNEKLGPNGERRHHPYVRKILNGLPFVPIVIFGIIGGKVALDIKNQSAPPPLSPAQLAYEQASQGDVAAQRKMASMYETGQAVTADPAEAYFWYSLSSAAGDKDSEAKSAELAGKLTAEQIAAISQRVKDWKPTPSDAK